MEDRDKILDFTKPVRLPDNCSKNRKNFTQGYYYREIGRYKNVVPSEFQWAAEDKLISKSSYEELKCQFPDSPRSTFLMVFSPDGKKVASTHGNHNVYVTDLTTGKNIQTLSGHPRTPWCIAFHPSSNQILASGCLGGQVRVWDLCGGSEVWNSESQTVIASLAFHPVDRMLVIATYNELHFWDWSQPEPFAKCSTKSGREKVRYVSFDRLGNKLITGIANPVNVPSQWDRISLVNSQAPMTSTTTTVTSTTSSTFNSRSSTTTVSSHPSNDHGVFMTSWFRNYINRYNHSSSMSRNTPTIDRGTDPMDLLDLRNSRNNSEGNSSTPSSSTSTSQANSSSRLRFKITRSACRSYRPLSSRERFQIHSSVFRRLSNRSSSSSNRTVSTTATSSVFSTSSTSSPSTPVSRDRYIPRLCRCAFSLSPTARSWCLTLNPENSPSLFTTRSSHQSSSSGAVTNPTFTSVSERGITSARESNPNTSERSRFSTSCSNRLGGNNEDHGILQGNIQSEPERESRDTSRSNPSGNDSHRIRNNLFSDNSRFSSRNLRINSPETEIERELQNSSSAGLRRPESESAESNRESPNGNEVYRSNRSSMVQLIPVNLIGRLREDANSDVELSESSGRDNNAAPQSLMHHRPVPRFQVRSRLLQDQQSQLHLLTNRETHGLNLQNNQNLRRQLSFRPGGQVVLSRHSNSPFQPRVPHQLDNSTQNNTTGENKGDSRLESQPLKTSRNSTAAEVDSPSSSSNGSSLSTNPVSSNLSFVGESSSQHIRDQSYRCIFDRVKTLLRDRIRNSSENASTDSTVNYSRISGESEADTLNGEEGIASRGLGPRGADPMLSSVSENLDLTNELLHHCDVPVSTPGNLSNVTSNNTSLNLSQSDILDNRESETDSSLFSINASLPLNDVFNDLPQSSHESNLRRDSSGVEQNETPTTSNNSNNNSLNTSSSEFNMRQGIQLLSLHIENMQRLCWARIEILQLQKIRRMWEDLTNQIRHFRSIILNRALDDSSGMSGINDSSNSGGDIPSMRNLAISTSPVPDRNVESLSSSENLSTSNNTGSFRNDFRDWIGTRLNVLFNEERESNFSGNFSNNSFQQSQENRDVPQPSNADSNNVPERVTPKTELEEPQPGPSRLESNSSTSNPSADVRNSITQLEDRVHRLLRDIFKKTLKRKKRKRRRESRDLGVSSNSFQRHGQHSGLRSCLRSHRFSRLDSSVSSSRALSRELEDIWQTWRNEKTVNRGNHSPRASNSCDSNEPSTSTEKTSTTAEACQSCGQKKKPLNEVGRQKKRSADSPSTSGTSSSASKMLKNNVGERSEVLNNETQSGEGTSSQSEDSSSSNLLKQMLQTMETILRFQREAFQSTKDSSEGSSSRQNLSSSSSGEDSDSEQEDSNVQRYTFLRNLSRRRVRRGSSDSGQDIAQQRAKRLLGFMVKSLNEIFGNNFRNLNQVLDEQIFSLYMLLDLALELTDLLLEQLNARSRDLEQNWRTDNLESSYRNTEFPRASLIAERLRERSRRTYIPLYSPSRRDSRYRFSINPFLRSHSSSSSARQTSSETPSTSHDRFSRDLLSSSFRRKRSTARMSTSRLPRYYRRGRTPSQTTFSNNLSTSNGTSDDISSTSRYRSFSDRRLNDNVNFGLRSYNYEINNNSNRNDTNNNYRVEEGRNGNSNPDIGSNNNDSSLRNNLIVSDNRNAARASNSSDINSNNNSLLNYYFPNSSTNSRNSESGNNIIIMTGFSSGNGDNRNNNSTENGSNDSFLNQNSLPPLRPMGLTISRSESGDISLRDERPIIWIRYSGNEGAGSLNGNESQSRVSSLRVPIVQVNDVPVSDVSMLNQPRHRPQSPVPRTSEEFGRLRGWRPRFLHPRYSAPNPFDDQDLNDVHENIQFYRILSGSGLPHLGLYALDPLIITDAPMSAHHRIQAWDFSKLNIPDISDREANSVVPECKIHNDASVDVSNDGRLLVTLLPSGRLSVTTMLGVYSLDWSSLGQLLYRTSFEQNAVSVSLSPTNRHLLVGLASRPVVLRDRTNMAQIFRLEGGRPSPQGGSWQSGRGRLVHMRDLEQIREMNYMSLNCIRWAPGAGQGLVYGTNTGQLKILR